MTRTITWLGAMGLALGLLLGNRGVAAQETPAQPAADPAVWGIYAQLAGSTRQASDGYRMHWRWSQPGKELVEEYFAPSSGKLMHTSTITPGPGPGTLHVFGSSLGGKEWNGTLQPDGSVVFAGTGMLKLSYKATIGSDGAYEIRGVKVRDGVVVSTRKLTDNSRYLPIDDAATRVATAVEAPGAVPVAIAATADTAKAADPAIWGLYARLVGTSWSGEGDKVSWKWGTGNTIVEDRSVVGDTVISPGARPGELVGVYGSGISGATYDGHINPDGSILWLRRGLLKTPQRVAIVDGRYREELVKLDGANQVIGVKNTGWYSQVGGTPENTAAAAAASGKTDAATAPAPVSQAAPVLAEAVNAGPGAATLEVPASAPSFGFLDRYIGRSFVSPLYTLDVYREGDALALHFGHAGGERYGRYLVQLDTAGTYRLVETVPATSPGSRLAYFDSEGALVIEYTGDNYRFRDRFLPAGDALQVERFGVERRFGRYGALRSINSVRYGPATEEALQLAAIKNQAWQDQQRREEQEARERKHERDAQWSNNMNAVNQGLQQALAEATAREAQSRAALDATIQQAAQQAAYEHELAVQRGQQQANTRAADDAQRAREATERQNEIARQYEAQRQAQQQAQAAALVVAAKPAPTPSATAPAAGSGQWFVFCVAIKPGAYMDAPGALFLSAISAVARQGYSSQASAESFGSRVSAQYGVSVGSGSCNSYPDHATAQARWQEQHDSFGLKSYKKVATGMPATP